MQLRCVQEQEERLAEYLKLSSPPPVLLDGYTRMSLGRGYGVDGQQVVRIFTYDTFIRGARGIF